MVYKDFCLFFDFGHQEDARCGQDTEENQGHEHDPYDAIADSGFKTIDAARLDVGKNKGQKKQKKKGAQQINDAEEHAPDRDRGNVGQDSVPRVG